MFVGEVIETPLPPAILLSVLSPATVIHLALHGPSLNSPDQDLHLALVLTLVFFTVSAPPVPLHCTIQYTVLLAIGNKHLATPRSRAAGNNVKQILSPQFLPSG